MIRDAALFVDLARELLARGHRVRFCAEGGSMHPAIRGGEAVVVEPVETRRIAAGDVLLYSAGSRVIAHRVVGIESNSLQMRGDAPGGIAERIGVEQVLGRVSGVERTSLRSRLLRRIGGAVAALLFAALPATHADAAACTFTAAGTGTWTAIAWTRLGILCSTYPGQSFAGDTVTIAGGRTVALDVSPAFSVASVTLGGGGNGTLTLGNDNTDRALTVTGAVTIAAGSTFNTGGNGGNTLTVGGNLANLGTVDMNIGAATATIAFNGAAQSIGGTGTTEFRNSNFAGSGTKTLAGAILSRGNLDIASGVTLDTSAISYAVTLEGDFTNSGTFTANASTITFAGTNNQSIAAVTTTGSFAMTKTGGTATLMGNANAATVNVNGTGGTVNLGAGLTHTFTGVVTAGAGTINGGSSTMRLGASITPGAPGTAVFMAGTGTVDWYAAGPQTVLSLTYYNLTLSGSNTKTLGGDIQVDNTLTIASGVTLNTSASNFIVVMQGDFVNAGTFTANASNIYISGIKTQSIAAFTTTGNVFMTKTAGTATLGGVMNGGTFTLDGTGGTLDLGSSLTHTITGNFTRTNGSVNGANSYASGTFGAGTTVSYNAAGAQNAAGGPYYNLTFATSGAKTLRTSTTSVGGTLSLTGSATTTTVVGITIGALSVGNGTTFTAAGFNITVSGATTVGTGGALATLVVSSAAGTKIFNAVTVATNAVWNNSGNSLIQLRGNLTHNGTTFTAGSGTYTFNTTTPLVIAGSSALSIPSLTVDDVYVTDNATLTVGTLLTVTNAGGVFDQGCTYSLSAGKLSLTASGSYVNCTQDAGGSGTLTFTGGAPELAVGSGSRFDYIGTGAITFVGAAANVTNAGIIRINGGSNTCGSGTVTITSAANNTWTTSAGSFFLADVNLVKQVSSGAAPLLYGISVKDAASTGWGAVTANCAGSQTLVKLEAFTAEATSEGNRITVRTSRDVNNLGFNLYREENGQRVKTHVSMLAGSALMARAGTFTAGQTRRWLDSKGKAGDLYWLEEVDLSGVKTPYGPAVATMPIAAGKATREIDSAPVEPLHAARTLATMGRATGAMPALKASVTAKAAPTQQSIQKQYEIAAGGAIRLGVSAEGLYRVTQSQLAAAGLGAGDPRTLQLYLNGVQQPIHLQTAVKGQFGPQDSLYFYGTGSDSIWSDTQAYWLVAGTSAGQRMNLSGMSGGFTASSTFPATIAWKPRELYFAALSNGDENNFFGPVVTDVAVTQDLIATRVGGAGATLRVKLQGVTDGRHLVTVKVNGVAVGNAALSGQQNVVVSINVPALNEGANTLTLTASSADDVTAVDEVQLTYSRRFVAENEFLRLTAEAGNAVRVDGFSSSSGFVVDVTDPSRPALIQSQMSGSGSGYALTFVPPEGAGTRTLVAVGSGQLRTPTITPNVPSSWNAPQAGYDMVILTHKSLRQSAIPLATLRQSKGLKVAVVDVEDLYDEFGFGVKTPYAIKAFLSTAKANWATKPRFVLLLGNGTFDPRNFLKTAVPDLLPVKLVDTALMETASDDWFVDFDDDGIPDMAIGRMPAETAAQADTMIARTVAYDQTSPEAWATRALLVSGLPQNTGDDFAAQSTSVRSVLPSEIVVTELVQAQDPTPRATLLSAINAGQALLNFLGHGSVEVWAGSLFDASAAQNLANGAKVPVVLTMTCLNGYFQDVFTTALGKALLTAPNGGAVAVWASSGLTEPNPQSTMNRAMVQALYATPAKTLGEAAAAAKAAITDIDVRRTWVLLGDPSVVIQ